MHLEDDKATQPTDGTSTHEVISTDTMAYTNCTTRIIDLSPLELPQDPNISDVKLREIYRSFISTNGSHSPSTLSINHNPKQSPSTDTKRHAREVLKTEEANSLVAAILSLKTGIAPPVAFPTETVYGLGADATNHASIAGIFATKGRPSDNPLIVHVSSTEHLERCLGGTKVQSAIPDVYRDLINDFWPGPLTILIPVPEDGKGVKFAANVHPGQKTIGFRVPSSLHARFLLAVADRPIAAPSANSSGKPSPTTAQHVKDDLDGKINFILDGGSCDVGVESTVVDGLGETPVILRPGGLSRSTLRTWGLKKSNVWQYVENGWEKNKSGIKRRRSDTPQSNGMQQGKARKVVNGDKGDTNGNMANSRPDHEGPQKLDEAESRISEAPRAPGMKYKHYAPKARMFLFESSSSSGSEPNMKPIYNKLKELLAARDITQNTECSHILKGESIISRVIKGPTHRLTIGVLRSTAWKSHGKDFEAPFIDGHFPAWKPTQQPSCHLDSTVNPRFTTHLDINGAADNYTKRQVRLVNINLGEDSATISRNLFAALRTCDDVGCDWIFAEAPRWSGIKHVNGGGDRINGEIDEDEFETVLERLRKAATEIVYY